MGLGLLIGVPHGRPDTHQLMGAVAALLAAAGFAIITRLGTRPVEGLDDAAMTGTGLLIGGALLTPISVATGGLGFSPTPAALGAAIALGLVPTAAAYLLYFRALR